MALINTSTWDFTLEDGDLVVGNVLAERVQMALFIERGSAFWDRELGSELHTLKLARQGQTEREAERMVQAALTPLVRAGLIRRVACSAALQGSRLTLSGQITASTGQPVAFRIFRSL